MKFARIDSLFPNAYADLIKLKVSSEDLPEQLEINKELLKSIKTAFSSKCIIMDLWATWCGPCLGNMPYHKKLQQEAEKENLPVVFIYLCTDGNSSESVWQNKIAELEQPGEHIFVQNSQMNELLTLFNGAGYPTYAVIKPNGQIDTKTISFNRKIDIEGLKKLLNELMRIYRDLDLVEQLGSGVPRILEHYDRSFFKFFPNFIRMTFPKSSGSLIGGQIGGQIQIDLTPRQKQVLEIIQENPTISRSQLSSKIGINESAIQKHIETLRDKKIIDREGGTRGYWKILIR